MYIHILYILHYIYICIYVYAMCIYIYIIQCMYIYIHNVYIYIYKDRHTLYTIPCILWTKCGIIWYDWFKVYDVQHFDDIISTMFRFNHITVQETNNTI